MTKTYDIIVGGGGIIGSVTALAFAKHGLTVALVDEKLVNAKKNIEFDSRAYALSRTTINMLCVLGVWKDLVKIAQPILDMKVSDGVAGRGVSPFYMHFDHRDMEAGPIGYMVEDRFLKSSLWDSISRNTNISKFFGYKIINQNVNSRLIEVQLENKRKIFGKLLVGSDGRRSTIAERSGIKRNTFDYGQTSIVCAVSHERDHLGEAHQFFMPPGPLAILPLKNRISSIVWTEKSEEASHLKTLSDAKFLKELKPRFGNFRGQISLKGARYFFPLSLSISKKLVVERVALVGDSAHVVHPIAGQGLNLGMRDVASLVEIITIARRCGEDFGTTDVLVRYSTWRDFDRLTLYSFTHLVNKVFSNDSMIIRTLRGIGMGAINNIPGIRRALMEEASGHGEGLPLLMSGRRI